jgi:hypothetical protein
MGRAVPENDLPGSVVPEDDLPGAVDNSKYGGALNAAGTFAANAINSLTLGLPDYLNKTFTPETYAETEKYKAANPIAATGGEIAGYAIPTVAGAVKGAKLGVQAADALARRFAPALPDLGRWYGRSQGALTGGTMGAQTAAAVPGIVQGEPGKAVAGPSMINQAAGSIPMIHHLNPVMGNVVPAAAGAAASAVQGIRRPNWMEEALNMARGYNR